LDNEAGGRGNQRLRPTLIEEIWRVFGKIGMKGKEKSPPQSMCEGKGQSDVSMQGKDLEKRGGNETRGKSGREMWIGGGEAGGGRNAEVNSNLATTKGEIA